MTREDKLFSMTGPTLIKVADELGVKVACNKARTKLTEAKAKVIDRILAAEAEIAEAETEEVIEETEVTEEIPANTLVETPAPEKPIAVVVDEDEEPAPEEKQVKKPSLKLKELTFEGRTQTIKEWAAELEMPWPTLYDRVNRNGWSVEEALTIPLGQRRKKA